MDSTNNLAPLFEAQLELQDPHLIFIPSLEPDEPNSFQSLIIILIDNIISMPSFVPRFVPDGIQESNLTYRQEIEAHQDIIEMKADILTNIEHAVREANEFCDSFHNYSYLWLDDRNAFLKQFLLYGRQLTQEEMELVQMKDSSAPKLNPPKMESFREQVTFHTFVTFSF